MNFLYAAYAATWIIQSSYIGTLARRYKRLQREIEELQRPRAKPAGALPPERRER